VSGLTLRVTLLVARPAACYHRHELVKALLLIESGVHPAVPTIRDLLNDARELVISGELARARAICERVLERYPKHVEAHVLLGEAAREGGQFDDARHLFLTALTLDPENGIGYWALGLIAEQEGQRDGAVSFLERALEYLPGDADLWQAIRRVRSAHPELSPGGLGRLYLHQGLFHRARRELDAALQDQPTRLDLRLALAECLWRMGRVPEARARCEEALETSPDCLKALLLLADCNRQQRRLGAAERLLRRAAQVDPDGDLAASLFADADPAWIRHEPVELDQEPAPDDAPVETAAPATWIEHLAQLHEPPRPAPGPRLSHWFEEPVDAEPSDAVEETLLENESLAPWHSLLSVEVPSAPDLEARLSAALAELTAGPPAPDDGWRDVTLGGGAGPLPDGSSAGVGTAHDLDAFGLPHVAQLNAEATEAALPEGANGTDGVQRVDQPDNTADEASPDDRRPSPVGDNAPGARLEQTLRQQRAGEWNAAIDGYASLIRDAPDLVPDFLESLRELADAQPRDPSAHRVLADACMACGQFQRAVDEYYFAFTAKQAAV